GHVLLRESVKNRTARQRRKHLESSHFSAPIHSGDSISLSIGEITVKLRLRKVFWLLISNATVQNLNPNRKGGGGHCGAVAADVSRRISWLRRDLRRLTLSATTTL